uniref:NADH dehydrogenase subunit 6 n=1 Tax=Cryptocercus punctulatus TaxID=36984 RepID=UPI00286B26A0|nr:NADH dehydrogenase subunit 6 [Cryptocercus punctulatus]WLF00974.1 NADH dehydrogenase subunit 6 [Cryptocercus punctulatus]
MNKILLSLSMMISMVFTQINHPLAMGFLLLLQTILMCMMSGLLSKSFWFAYILFMIFIGGMLVLFIYVTSLASNEMFMLSMKIMIMSTIMFTLMMTMMNWMKINNQEIMTNDIMNSNLETQIQLNKLYNKPNGMLTILLALYMFLTLIAVVKIINITKGPLRQMN